MTGPLKIHPLSLQVANQIAAGEVIERPASVVKELLENALDAGARHITIEIGYGGLNQITVSDDGLGIHAEDLPLAVAPHATSKLRVLDDLNSIATMGFRGEALASIASVSRLSIESRPQHQALALGVRVEAGQVECYACARNPGTTVDVRDLFFNAPVRKKFLKTADMEYLAIESVVKRFAFCASTIGLTLLHNGKLRLRVPGALTEVHQQQRLRKVFGKAFCEQSVAIDAMHDGMQLSGWVSASGYARSQQDKQWVYLNGRMVRDKLILHAIKLAYEGLLVPGRFPSCVLTLTMPPEAVDVNVHPTKHEVRFTEPRAVHDFVRFTLRNQLTTDRLIEDQLTVKERLQHAVNQPPHGRLDWQCVNSRFALVSEEGLLHLIHVARLRQEALFSQLLTQKQPWPSRNLLLPIDVNGSADVLEISRTHQLRVRDFGVHWQVEGDRLKVQAIPRDFPGLDLALFLDTLAAQKPHSLAQWITCFLASGGWDLRHIPPEEQAHWLAIWRESRVHSRRLDELSCEEFICA